MPLGPITIRAPNTGGDVNHLVLSSTTNLENPEFPWQGQPYREHAQVLTRKMVKINGLKASCIICIFAPIRNIGY